MKEFDRDEEQAPPARGESNAETQRQLGEEIVTCIPSSKQPVIITTPQFAEQLKAEKEPILPEKTDEEKRLFANTVEALKRQGANVQIIPSGSTDYAVYLPTTDLIRVHGNDFPGLLEEATHREQVAVMEQQGFKTKPSLDDRMVAMMAEIGAVTRVARVEEQELGKVKKRHESKPKEARTKELEQELGAAYGTLLLHRAAFYQNLAQLGKEKLPRYKGLLEHPLFEGARQMVEWWEKSGYYSPRYKTHSPTAIITCLPLKEDAS